MPIAMLEPGDIDNHESFSTIKESIIEDEEKEEERDIINDLAVERKIER